MANINVLDQSTINKIAAGEVIERPQAVVKELVENALDAKASAITVEIKEGGISFIRITDNGSGIGKEDISTAFLRHATSKIKTAEDLITVSSLGFRGEALSSIAAVSQVELVTKTPRELNGVRYIIEGGVEKMIEDIGCPEGTTMIVRNLFYNTPARRKFLKSPTTEAGYINDLIERMAVSHPEVSFKFINNNQIKLHTMGNGNVKDIIYHVYGREIAANIVAIRNEDFNVTLDGYVGKPVISRGNRNYENYFINGRYIRSALISKAIEDAYKPYSMTHRYPFTTIHFEIAPDMIDVNVHPTKMEIRFKNSESIYHATFEAVKKALSYRELIPSVSLVKEEKQKSVVKKVPEPFEVNRIHKEAQVREIPEIVKYTEIGKLKELTTNTNETNKVSLVKENITYEVTHKMESKPQEIKEEVVPPVLEKPKQIELFETPLLAKEAKPSHRIVGQVFSTYWIVEFIDKMFLIDQHAAHEKVLFEKTMRSLQSKTYNSQMVMPPIIVSLNMREEEVLKKHMEILTGIGYEIESFGGKEYSLRAVPGDLFGIAQKDLFIEFIDSLIDSDLSGSSQLILEKVASMSCKAAVKGNMKLSVQEANMLIDELMELENPYHCPHGRPVIISMSKSEIEKKFKRIV